MGKTKKKKIDIFI